MRVDSLYLSPHLDDAIFSCAGQIQEDVSQGRSVLIATVFSQGEGYKDRRAEDQRAAQTLGAQVLWLDRPDAPYRSAFYRDYRSLMLGLCPSDEETIVELQQQLRALLLKLSPARCAVPLAVGGHVDHRLLFEAMNFQTGEVALRWYEDRPYALTPGLLQLRRAQLLAPPVDRPQRAHLRRMLLQGLRSAPWTCRYLPPGRDRFAVGLRMARDLPQVAQKPSLQEQTRHFSADIKEGAERAIACYQSQLGPFFDGLDGYRRATLQYTRALGGEHYAERCYSVPSARCA